MKLNPRKEPQQQRSAAMVSFILDAAARVLNNGSLATFNTNAVAQAAGISIGSLYQYFPNKSALMVALIEKNQTIRVQALNELVASNHFLSFERKVKSLATFAVAQQYDSPRLAAALDYEEKHLPIDARLRHFDNQLVKAIHQYLAPHKSQIQTALTLQTIYDCLVIAKSIVDASAPTVANKTHLTQRIYRALMGYLTYSQSTIKIRQ